MKQAVKTLVLFTILFSLVSTSYSQIKLPVANGIAPIVKKVLQDYPNRFANLQGELLIEHAQSADYACNFKVEGAEQATVSVYSSTNKKSASWQALMLTTDDFELARKKFKALNTQVNNLSLQLEGSNYQLKGKYEEPAEVKKFTGVVYSFGDKDEAMKRVKVEVSMQYELMEWKVRVLVYDRDREDEERGPAKD